MKFGARLTIFFSLLALVAGLVVFVAMAYLRSNPPTLDLAASHEPGEPVHMTLETVGQIGFGPHPLWVSYLTKSPEGKWVHTTLWDLPEDTRIDVTVYEFDSGGPLRNPEMDRVYGTIGNHYLLNGKPVSLLNGYEGNGIAHTFSVPALGINVPLWGVNSSAKNFCSSAPCPMSDVHNVIQFSFKTPSRTGQFHWQCFIPCGLGYLYGNGGPMQTIGYMGGFLKVVD